jgi:AcrR family transcriptional regulator
MTEVREDRRVQRTRLTLRSAMTALIREQGFESLTVQDIIDRANVGRSTFYAHFKSKEDLLKGSVEMMRSSLRQFQRRALAAPGKPEDRLFAFTRELFEHAEQHRETFAAMVGKRSGSVFVSHLHRMLADVIRDDLALLASRKRAERERVEIAVQFITAGLIGILEVWLAEFPKIAAAEMDARFHEMAVPVVRSVVG